MANGSGFDNGPAVHADPLQAPEADKVVEKKKSNKKIAKFVAIGFAVIVLAVLVFA